MNYQKTGISLISDEREEQIMKHNRTVLKDILENTDFQLSQAASVLCINYPTQCLTVEDVEVDHIPYGWNMEIWVKIVNKSYEERLVIAGALIAAELDRINECYSKTS